MMNTPLDAVEHQRVEGRLSAPGKVTACNDHVQAITGFYIYAFILVKENRDEVERGVESEGLWPRQSEVGGNGGVERCR